MPFKKVLVSVDGSPCSQIAVEYALWLSDFIDLELSAQHVVDPRVANLIVSPGFAEHLGFSASVDVLDKVLTSLEGIGELILDLVRKQAEGRAEVQTILDVGWVVDQIVARAEENDLLIVGHHGPGEPRPITEQLIGSVAERVIVRSHVPVLVAGKPIRDIVQIMVAFDGSEPARGALLLAEALAVQTKKPLQVVTVIPSKDKLADAHATVEQGHALLRHFQDESSIFTVREGPTTPTLLGHAGATGSLLVVGAYGFRTPEDNVLGSTTTAVVRKAETSVLIFR